MAYDFPSSPTEGQSFTPAGGGPTYIWRAPRWVLQASGGTGGSDVSYVHDQLTPATTWTVAHNLGQWPSVTVVDSGGNLVWGDIDYVNDNTVTVSFSVSFGGRAFCNV